MAEQNEALPSVTIYQGDNLSAMGRLAPKSFHLIYIDPPFNTKREQARTAMKTVRDQAGDRVGFKGNRYKTVRGKTLAYGDSFDDYLAFLEPRLVRARDLLADNGSLFVHIDYREVHYVKVLLDRIFGRDSFINEIIWAYDYGARSKAKWSTKHDNILFYAKDPKRYTFHYDEIDRIPYMAPSLVGEEKAARGKTLTDTWWHTIVSPTGKEKTGYPTQKPRGILDRIVKVHSNKGDNLLDFFAGSGSFGESAAANGRNVVLIDRHPDAILVMKKRLAAFAPKVVRDRA